MPTATPTTGGATPVPVVDVGRNPATGQFQSMKDVASALESLMTEPEGADNQDGDETTDDGPTEGDELEEGTEEEGTEDEGAEDDESEESEDEEPESDEDEDEPQQRTGRKFTVRIDGKDTQVTESELLAGYSRQSDYTRKTQALANERKEHEQEVGQARQERAEYAQLLPQLRKALESGMQEPDWNALRREDAEKGTSKYANAWAMWTQHREQLASIRAEEQRVAQQQAKEADATRAKRLKAEREKLIAAVPSWKDPKIAKRDSQAIARTMLSVGYTDDDIAVHDHRALQIALKAARYDALVAKQPKLRQQMRQAPVVQPGGGTPQPRSAAKQASNRLTQTGSVRDAASLLEHLI